MKRLFIYLFTLAIVAGSTAFTNDTVKEKKVSIEQTDPRLTTDEILANQVKAMVVPSFTTMVRRYEWRPVDDGMGGSEISEEWVETPTSCCGIQWQKTGRCKSQSGLIYDCDTGVAVE